MRPLLGSNHSPFTHQVTMYSSRLFSSSRDAAAYPPNHNIFAVTTLVVPGSNHPPTKSQCIHCDYSHCLETGCLPIQLQSIPVTTLIVSTQLSVCQVTMYSLRPLSLSQGLAIHPPSHNVFIATTLTVSRSNCPHIRSQNFIATTLRFVSGSSYPPTKSQSIPRNFLAIAITMTTHLVTMHPL